jgi:hypothetical protein
VPKSIKLKSFPPDQKRGLNFVTDVGSPKICLIAGLKSQDSCTPHDEPCTCGSTNDAPSIYGRGCRDIEQFL